MRIDLHAHSDRSDGTLSPRAVVRAAVDARLDVLGLTDHDTADGWVEAQQEASEVGLTLVCGMEISCVYAGRSAHLLGYLPDPDYPPLAEALTELLNGRDDRMPTVCARLRDLGIDISEQEVIEQSAGAAALGRPHVADVLIRRGVVATRDEAFDRFLSPGRSAYVTRYAPPLEEAIGLVTAAGGVPVLAHPWGRHGDTSINVDGFGALARAGLVGIEVDHQDHGPDQRAALRAVAGDLDLVVTGSSDFHGAGKIDHDLGCNLTAPDEFDRLLAAAALASRTSGRRTPDVVGAPTG